jgi:hypothetical protein
MSRLARTPSPTHPTNPTFPLPPRTPGRTPHFNPPLSARPLQPPPASHPPPPRPAFATDPVLYIHQQLQNLHEQQQQQRFHTHYDNEDQSSMDQYDGGFMDALHQNYDPPSHHQLAPAPSRSHATPHKPAFNPSLYPPVETAPSTSIPSLYNQTRSAQEDDRYANQDQSQFLHPRPGSRNGPTYMPSTSPHPSHQDPFHKYLPDHPNVQYPAYNPPPLNYGYDPNSYHHNPPLENILHHVMNSRAHQPPHPSFAPLSHHPSQPSTTRNPTAPKPSLPPAKPANAARPTSATRNAPTSARAKVPAPSAVHRTSAPIPNARAQPARTTTAPTKARNSPRLWK